MFSIFHKAPVIQNPLKIKEGQYVNLTTLDEQGIQFQVKSISEWDRTIMGNVHKFTDYFLVGKQDGKDVKMRLRMNPTAEKATIGLSQRILKLQLQDEMSFDADFDAMLREKKDDKDAPDFIIRNDKNEITSQWWRINDVHDSYKASIQSVAMKDAQGPTCVPTSIAKKEVEFFDYNRTITAESGHEKNEYLFIEIGQEDHMIQIWQGVEIDESEVFA